MGSTKDFPKRLFDYGGGQIRNMFRGNFVDDDAFYNICDGFVDFYEQRKDTIIKNILQIYALTDEELGYDALNFDWLKWKQIKAERNFPKTHEFTAEMIDASIKEKIYAACFSLYQAGGHKDTHHFGFIGLLIAVSLNVSIQGDEKLHVAARYDIQVQIGTGKYDYFEIHN